MKKIVFLLLLIISLTSQAQNKFPSVDSLQNYTLRYVKNSAVESFTNLRLQNILIGLSQMVDTLRGNGYVDSIWIGTGDTLKYRIGNTTFKVGKISGGGGGSTDSTIFATRYWATQNFRPITWVPTLQQVLDENNTSSTSVNIAGGVGESLLSEEGLGLAKNGFNFGTIVPSNFSSARTFTLPNKSGTFILDTDTASAFTPYLRSNVAAATYQPIGSYLTSVPTLQQVTNAGNTTTDSVVFNGNLGSHTVITSIVAGPDRIGRVRVKESWNNDNSLTMNSSGFDKIKSGVLYALTIPDSSGILTVGVKANGTTYMAGANGIADIGTIGGSSGIQWQGLDSSFAASSASNGVHLVEDFLGSSFSAGAIIYPSGLVPTAGGGGINFALENTRYGILTLSTAASSTASPYLAKANFSDSLNSLFNVTSYMIKLPTLSDGTETYHLRVGMTSQVNTANPNGGVYFVYSTAGTPTGSAASGNWQCVTGNGSSVRTWTTTSTAVTTGWTKLTIVASSTTCFFLINGVLVATHTTNIPTPALTPNIEMRKSAGTTARLCWVDYFTQDVKYSSAR